MCANVLAQQMMYGLVWYFKIFNCLSNQLLITLSSSRNCYNRSITGCYDHLLTVIGGSWFKYSKP
jgi:hypothetical protein